MMRALVIMVLLGGFAAQAEAVLQLPPSPEWVEGPDPMPPPTKEATTRFFRRQPDLQVTLRVTREPKMQLTYSMETLKSLQSQFVAYEQKRSKSETKLRVSNPRIFVVEDVNVGSFQVDNGVALNTIFYVPSDDGDLILGAYTALSRPADLQEVINAVQGAKNLRKPTQTPWKIYAVFGGLLLLAAALYGFRSFTEKKSTPVL